MTHPCRFRHRFLLVAWLAIVLSIGITADLVVDLVFETQEIEAASPSNPASEDTEDSAEHVLMPTQRDGQPLPSILFSPCSAQVDVSRHVGLPPDAIAFGRASPVLQAVWTSHPQSSPFVLRI